jgi:hypothetical protein
LRSVNPGASAGCSEGERGGIIRGVDNNPFAVLTAIVAPAILTNACSLLALGTSNRVARVVDRTRVLSVELSKLNEGEPAYTSRLRQIERLRQRSRLLLSTLRYVYASLGCFAACALLSVIGALAVLYDVRAAFHVSAAAALLVGLAAVVTLVVGSSTIVAETRVALQGMTEEVSDTLAERVI